jgi:DNA recombination protein RmuC
MSEWVLLALAGLNLLILLGVFWQRRSGASSQAQAEHIAALLADKTIQQTTAQVAHQTAWQQQHFAAAQAQTERLERELRSEINQSGVQGRQEAMHNLTLFQQSLLQQSAEATRTQNQQIDALAQQLALLQKSLTDSLAQQVNALSESNARRLTEMRGTMETQLAQLQQSNAAKLDEMRQTVDEKLQATLQARLGESFKQVAERLEQVHKGLGEMHHLAQGVGDLKHLLTNVKTRGMFGEAQLASLLEQVLTPEQYAVQVATRPGDKNRVDFAIRLPGRSDSGVPVWLPIDAKFPNEDYERLLEAQGRADPVQAELCAKALETRIKLEAKSMAEKYLEPPYTTDFAILFLPTEGLYAEVLRRPGLMETLQRDHRVTLAGPTNLMALLNALQMGFRTLALEKRSSEVWQVLGAVKTEFGKFGDVLDKVRNQTQNVLNTLDLAQTRSNVMNRALRQVDALPEPKAQALLPDDVGPTRATDRKDLPNAPTTFAR